LGRALLEEPVQLRNRRASRKAADVDARDLGPRSEFVLRAGERESDEQGEDDHDAGDPRDYLRDGQRTTTTARSGRIQG